MAAPVRHYIFRLIAAQSDPPLYSGCSYRKAIREPVAEFTGVLMLTTFGIGVNCQSVLSTNPNVSHSVLGVRYPFHICGPRNTDLNRAVMRFAPGPVKRVLMRK